MIKPLQNKKILITRTHDQNSEFAEKLTAAGAIPVQLPTIKIEPVTDFSFADKAIEKLNSFDWIIFTSSNAVSFFLTRLKKLKIDVSNLKKIKIAASGPSTAKTLKKAFIDVDLIPQKFIAEQISREIGDVSGKNILLPRGEIAREDLPDQLRAKGAMVTELILYKTVSSELKPSELAEIIEKGIDIITFTSSSTVEFFHEKIQKTNFQLRDEKIACIGPVTARTAEESGYDVWVVADPHSIDGLILSMEKALETSELKNLK
jgi:uroporphyrinogen-III synthase